MHAVGRQSVLAAAATLVKRAAAAQAELQVSGHSATSPHSRGLPSLMSPPFADPGPASPLVTFFMNELVNLLAPVTTSYQVEYIYQTNIPSWRRCPISERSLLARNVAPVIRPFDPICPP